MRSSASNSTGRVCADYHWGGAPPNLSTYFGTLNEQAVARSADDLADAGAGGPLSATGLEVLACIVFKQPLSISEVNRYFESDWLA